MRRCYSGLAAIASVLLLAAPAHAAGNLTIRFPSTNQGDVTIFTGPCGDTGVVDVPTKASVAKIVPMLEQSATPKLEWIAVTHYDADHIRGVEPLGTHQGVTVGTVYDRGHRTGKTSEVYKKYAAWARKVGRKTLAIDKPFFLCGEEVKFQVVSVARATRALNGLLVRDENDKGACLKITYLRFSMASCGDANGVQEGKRANLEGMVAPVIGRVDLVKVNHHGSRHSSNESYVKTLSPQAAVITVGKNSYGHPNPLVVRRWEATSEVFQTGNPRGGDWDGDVTVTTDGADNFRVTTSNTGRARTYPLAAAKIDEQRPAAGDDDDAGIPWWLLPLGILGGVGIGAAAWAARRHPVEDAQPVLAPAFAYAQAWKRVDEQSGHHVPESLRGPVRPLLVAIGHDRSRRVRRAARRALAELDDSAGKTERERAAVFEQLLWKLLDALNSPFRRPTRPAAAVGVSEATSEATSPP